MKHLTLLWTSQGFVIADKSQAVIIMALKTGKKLVSSLQPSPYLLQVQDAHALYCVTYSLVPAEVIDKDRQVAVIALCLTGTLMKDYSRSK